MLPSEQTARTILAGDVQGALPGLARDLVERSALIAAGLYVAGERDRIWRLAFAGAVAVEIGVLLYFARRA